MAKKYVNPMFKSNSMHKHLMNKRHAEGKIKLSNYHYSVYNAQLYRGRVLTKQERKQIYKNAMQGGDPYKYV